MFRLDIVDALCIAMLTRVFERILIAERRNTPCLLPALANMWIGAGNAIYLGTWSSGAPVGGAHRQGADFTLDKNGKKFPGPPKNVQELHEGAWTDSKIYTKGIPRKNCFPILFENIVANFNKIN